MLDYVSASKRRVFTLIFTVLTIFILAGCGQKGDLYLPNIPPAPDVMTNDNNAGPAISNENLPEQDKAAESNENLPATNAAQ